MDELDLKIIQILSKDADITTTAIKKEINLSVPAINKRIQTLKEKGMIKQFTVLTDGKKVGKPITAYVFVVLESSSCVEPLIKYINTDVDILECSAITGEYDYLLKICAESIEKLDEKVMYLKKYKGIIKTNTMLSLNTYKHSPTIMPNC